MNIAKSFYNSLRKVHFNFINRRLRSKLFLVYLIVTILPISFLVLYSNQTTKKQIVDQAVTNVGSTIDQINNNIENKLEMYKQISTLIYLDTELRNYLITSYEKNYVSYLDAYDYINKTFYKMLAMNPNLKFITLYTDNRSLPSDGYFIKHMDELPGRLVTQTFEAEGNITVFYLEDTDAKSRGITLARSLNYLSLNYPYGILTMEVTEREIYSLIEKETKNKSVIVADEDGGIITSGMKDASIRNIADIRALKGASATYNGSYLYSENGQEKMLVIQKPLRNGWRTVVMVPYDELLGQAGKATRKMLFISLGCIAAAMIMIYATSQFMTKRFEWLLQQIRKVERGSFDLSNKPMGNDEVGQLSFALYKMASTIQGLINDVYKKEVAKKDAEMNSLQAQITPHFLYNTLASISALAIKNNNMQVHEMADELARFYRISLNKGKKSISIAQEIKLTQHYLSIQKTRFDGLFNVHYKLDESLLNYITLKLIVQPFIENCINHAIWDDESGINIVIKLCADGDDIVFSIIDDGMGISRPILARMTEQTEQPAGYGIYNVNQRIKLVYGDAYGVKVYSRIGIGTTVQIRIPRTITYL
ncbi:two-component system sensor histidine kinase YesM [Paenibacillus taihuensis]|uniref:Two-component system sensor histidine kinase YesM n=1 Tax=Paenibacillus taihuensis TaxID=1156355 RepID=A0A3D9QY72_9BACL|nr:histidine kinase [Paenibacillus taihuensis]REE69742.1 two-component system sensor histidine kinase YesM [Paenibacillus taihuensis]